MPLALRIFLLSAFLVILAVCAAVAVTWAVGQRIAAQAVAQALRESAEAQASQTQQRLNLLERTLLLLGRDPALVNYVVASLGEDELGLGEATGPDLTSLRDLLIERRSQFGFDLGLVLDAEGMLLARSDESEAYALSFADDPLVAAARLRLAPQSGFWRMEDMLYQAAILPLSQDGGLIGFLLLAQRIDSALSRDIARASDAEIAFWLATTEGLELVASSLSEERALALKAAFAEREALVQAVRTGQSVERFDLHFGGGQWLVRLRPTAEEGISALGVVSSLASGDAVVSGYRLILDRVLLAGASALAVALPLSFWLSRRILRPARMLAEAAEKAAAGDYQTKFTIAGSDELARLGRAFDSLLSDLREKSDIEGYVANFSRFLPDSNDATADSAPARPSLPVPRVLQGVLLGAEFVPADMTQIDAPTRFGQFDAMATEIGLLAQTCLGRILACNGQRWLLGFEGAEARLRALQACHALLTEVQIEGFHAPALVLAEGEVTAGVVRLGEREHSGILGIAGYRLERLLGESSAGRVLLTRSLGEAIRNTHGTELLSVAEGAQSGKRFYALNGGALAALKFPQSQVPISGIITTRVQPIVQGKAGALRPSTRFGGRYEILSLLGEGGMGVVYKARDLELDDIVALKMLKSEALQDREQLERLKDEIRLARKITHPNVLRTFDFGESDGLPFISMEFVRGVTLRSLLSESSRLPYSAGLRIARQLCAGLAAAHAVGVVHRDIKPENLILEAGGNAKLMDFGIARPIRRAQAGHTQPGMYIGTPSYSAPEQLAGEELDARADVYSSGVMLCEMFCGGLPYNASSTVEIYRQQLHELPLRPSALWPEIPSALEEIILRCISRERAARYQSMAELGADLAQLRA